MICLNELDKNVENQLPEDGKFEIIHEDENSDILLCTPLGNQPHNNWIMPECKKTILEDNKNVKVAWYSYESHFNCAGNKNFSFFMAKKRFIEKGEKFLPRFLIFCNRDIEWSPGVLRRMMNKLKGESKSIGYCYGAFQRYGDLNITIGGRVFDPNELLYENYIDNNGLFRTNEFDNQIRFDTTLNNYDDWDLFLSWYRYHCTRGILFSNRELIFRTHTDKNDISYGPKWFSESTQRIREKHLEHAIKRIGIDDPLLLNGRMERALTKHGIINVHEKIFG